MQIAETRLIPGAAQGASGQLKPGQTVRARLVGDGENGRMLLRHAGGTIPVTVRGHVPGGWQTYRVVAAGTGVELRLVPARPAPEKAATALPRVFDAASQLRSVAGQLLGFVSGRHAPPLPAVPLGAGRLALAETVLVALFPGQRERIRELVEQVRQRGRLDADAGRDKAIAGDAPDQVPLPEALDSERGPCLQPSLLMLDTGRGADSGIPVFILPEKRPDGEQNAWLFSEIELSRLGRVGFCLRLARGTVDGDVYCAAALCADVKRGLPAALSGIRVHPVPPEGTILEWPLDRLYREISRDVDIHV